MDMKFWALEIIWLFLTYMKSQRKGIALIPDEYDNKLASKLIFLAGIILSAVLYWWLFQEQEYVRYTLKTAFT